MIRSRLRVLITVLAGLGAACSEQPTAPDGAFAAAAVDGARTIGAVYLTSNAPGSNEILAFNRAADGRLTPAGAYPTGGAGTGTGLGNQASMVLTRDHRYLYAVNAGSDDVSTFRITQNGLRRVGEPVPSGGDQPISVSVHGDLLYVLNAGDEGGIAGFRIGPDGTPVMIPGSARPLGSAAAGPAQIQFSPDGRVLVVTEKATSTITTYVVDAEGRAGPPHTQPSAGETPFGFNFNRRGDLVVSEAAGGAAGASTASSYRLRPDGSLDLISGAVPTTQSAACWIVISENGSFAFTTNTGSGSVSSLAIGPGGSLTLHDAIAGVTGPDTLPQDATFTPGGRFLYVRNAAGTIAAFRMTGNGELTHIGDFGPLPDGANGIVAL